MSSIERAMERMRRGEKAASGTAPDRPAQDASGSTAASPAPAHPVEERRRVYDVKLDLLFLRRMGMLTPDADHRDLQEQYRLVKRQVITRAFAGDHPGPHPGNLIQVTSSMSDEGKTFTAFNLGMSIAMEVDFTVLLIDADLTRQSLTQLVGLGGRPGMTEILAGEVTDVRDVVFRTDIPRLAVIPAGRAHPRSTELIASDGMRRLSRELATRYPDRLVIFDSTPLLMDSQAATLAGHMGQVVVVVEAGRTQEQVIREAVGLLELADSRVGLLLNKSFRRHGYGTYGGY